MPETRNVISAAEVDARKARLLEEAAARPKKYSVYEITERLREMGVYPQCKAMLEQNDLWERLLVIHEVTSDNQYFTEYYPQIKVALQQLLPDVNIDEKLAECEVK